MKLWHIPLKLQDDFNMTDQDELAKDWNSVLNWEKDATEEHEDNIKQYYAKLHKPIYTKLLLPFLYVWIKKEFNDIIDPPKEDKGFLD
ncbi:hypothetical protein [Flagellimonas sp. CMM7]|uniref:hypothetical protein n=1 Tax=Flagellimonas sp. CMM7 TaxID=2654676 RepID=UPI0013D63C3E|nr:hypothetical protein [Flagellimonas sp. CMM7]UII79564.1 hypothetical protein LV704_18125 [Flagellimonas sp. CMM7]